jgi:hypothetical protein
MVQHALAQEKAVEVLNEVYCLGARACTPYSSVEIYLPANTVKWFYTVMATKNRRTARRLKKNPALLATFPDLVAVRADEQDEAGDDFSPVFIGDANCSVYLLKHAADGENFTTAGSVYYYYPDYSKSNIPSLGMVIDEPKLCFGTQRLGLKNPHAFMEPGNTYVVLTVVAITR